MRKLIILVTVLFVLLALAGCTELRWPPTLGQQQLADIVVQDLVELRPYVDPVALPLLTEATQAAKVTQVYMGLPKVPIQSGMAAGILDAVRVEAARTPPTPQETLVIGIEKVEQYTETGINLAYVLATVIGSVAATWGATKLKRRSDDFKARLINVHGQLDVSTRAVQDIVRGIDLLDGKFKEEAKISQHHTQSDETFLLVAEARVANDPGNGDGNGN